MLDADSGGSTGADTDMNAAGGQVASTGGTSAGGATLNPASGATGSGGVTGGVGGGSVSGTPSDGCGQFDAQTGPLQLTATEGVTVDYIVSLPDSYDPNLPSPLAFVFPGANNTGEACQNGHCNGFQETMADHAIVVYPTAPEDHKQWFHPERREENVQLFSELLEHMKSNYCVDESFIFASGFSSGASFTNLIGCKMGNELLAVTMVAGFYPFDTCSGVPAALIVHGVDDVYDNRALGTRDAYLERSSCDGGSDRDFQTVRDAVEAAHIADSQDHENFECVNYLGCAPSSPVRLCTHGYGGPAGTTHTWPNPTSGEIWDFVSELPR